MNAARWNILSIPYDEIPKKKIKAIVLKWNNKKYFFLDIAHDIRTICYTYTYIAIDRFKKWIAIYLSIGQI